MSVGFTRIQIIIHKKSFIMRKTLVSRKESEEVEGIILRTQNIYLQYISIY